MPELLKELNEILNPRHTAVVVVDMQNDFAPRTATFTRPKVPT